MGAAASTAAPTGTYGQFKLAPDQQRRLDIMSNLFELLLRENNIMNLSQLLATKEDACSNLIITLSAELDKRFQRLRFDDPTQRVQSAEVGFLSEAQYRKIQQDQVRRTMCDKIAAFLVQFVILVAAMTSSVMLLKDVPHLIEEKAVFVPVIAKDAGSENEIPRRIFQAMKDARLVTGDVRSEIPGLEIYELLGDYYVHYKGFLYQKTGGTDSYDGKVFKISINWMNMEECGKVSGSSGPPGPQGFGSAPQGAPGSTSGTSTWGLSPSEQFQHQLEMEKLKAARAQEQASYKNILQKERELEQEKSKKTALEVDLLRTKAQGELLAKNRDKKEMDALLQFIDSLLNPTNFPDVAKVKQIIDSLPTFQEPKDLNQIAMKAIKRTLDNAKNLYNDFVKKLTALNRAVENPGIRKEELDAAFKSLESVYANNIINSLLDVNTKLEEYVGTHGTPDEKAMLAKIKTERESANSSSVLGARSSSSSSSYRGSGGASARIHGGADDYLLFKITEYSTVPTGPTTLPQPPTYSSSNEATMRPGFPTGLSSGFPTRMEGGQQKEYSFVSDFAGNTYETLYFCRMGGRVSKAERSIPLRQKLREIFANTQTESVRIENVASKGKERGAEQLPKFAESLGVNKQTIDTLLGYFGKVINKSATEIPSPAAYRAYLLMSDIGQVTDEQRKTQNVIQFNACEDKWQSKNFSSIPAYSLFGSLYKVIFEKTTESSAPTALIEGTTFKKLSYTKSDSTDTVWNQAFDYGTTLLNNELIRQSCRGINMSSNPKAVTIVKTAYRQLQDLYLKQLKQVVDFMSQIFEVDDTFINALAAPSGFQTSEPILRLHKRFVANQAERELITMIQQGRKILDEHYTAVEKTYTKALIDLGSVLGPTATPATSGGKRKTRRNLSKQRKQTRRS